MVNMCSESLMMRVTRRIGLEKVSWSLRRLHVPVVASDLVLEVGSGGNPYFRANVLLDAYEETRERHWEPLVADRPTVLGFVEKLPFKDKTFDFVIASHVLEHSTDPEAFLNELQRVAKAGYIEVPDAFMERINPYIDHRLEITIRNDSLLIRKKPAHEVDAELVELYSNKAKNVIANETMSKHPYHFHVRYYWENKIDFHILNPEVDANWTAKNSIKTPRSITLVAKIKKNILKFIRAVFSQNKRNSHISLHSLIQCVCCNSANLIWGEKEIVCSSCNMKFQNFLGIPNMSVGNDNK